VEVLASLNELRNVGYDLAVTIGNFDGVHRGHQQLIKDIMALCEKNNECLVVCTFVPHPKFILTNNQNFLINSYIERRDLLAKLGVKFLVEFEFNRDFSTQTPQDFLDNYISIANVSSLYLGHDFAFGANKSGDHDFVKKYCNNKNINCVLEKEFTSGDASKVSSTSVRDFLVGGDINNANNLLGRNFYVTGRVIKGVGRGKTIGFPTANIIFPNERLIPKTGVYKSSTMINGMRYNSITNIGHNPTFNDSSLINFETHIFDFDNDIYGEEITIELIDFIRPEKKFNNVNELISQINLDIEDVKK